MPNVQQARSEKVLFLIECLKTSICALAQRTPRPSAVIVGEPATNSSASLENRLLPYRARTNLLLA